LKTVQIIAFDKSREIRDRHF